MTPITDEQRLAEIRSRLIATTPTPWRMTVTTIESRAVYVTITHDGWNIVGELYAQEDDASQSVDDHDFIAQAPDDMKWLLDRATHQQRAIDNEVRLALKAGGYADRIERLEQDNQALRDIVQAAGLAGLNIVIEQRGDTT